MAILLTQDTQTSQESCCGEAAAGAKADAKREARSDGQERDPRPERAREKRTGGAARSAAPTTDRKSRVGAQGGDSAARRPERARRGAGAAAAPAGWICWQRRREGRQMFRQVHFV